MAMASVLDNENTTVTMDSSNKVANMLSMHSSLLQGACQENDKRLVTRLLHGIPTLRKQLTPASLLGAVATVRAGEGSIKDNDGDDGARGHLTRLIIQLLEPLAASRTDGVTLNWVHSPASEAYLALLTAIYFLQQQQQQKYRHKQETTVTTVISSSPPMAGLLEQAISRMEVLNVRALDPLIARAYYFLGRAHEMVGSLPTAHAYLMLAFRATRLRHDLETHATIYNLLLRTLLFQSSRYETAQQLVRQAPFPGISSDETGRGTGMGMEGEGRTSVSGANQARYHYYVAYLRALQAEYGPAEEHLQAALRKAPHGPLATGLLQAVHQLLVVVQLLRGEIPARALFRTPSLGPALHAYFSLTQAVQAGDTTRFQLILAAQEGRFVNDRTLPLVRRLHQNVLKAGLKRLAVAYSRLPLIDVAAKLGLPSVEDAAFVLMKALKENIIEGRVEWEGGEGHLASGARPVAYYTRQPQEALHERILRLDALHNESLRGMRFSSIDLKRATANVSGPTNKKDNNGGPATEAEMLEEYMDADDFM